VNPDFELKSSGMKMGGGPKPFGVDAERVPDHAGPSAANCRSSSMGFHIFSGSQSLKAEALKEAQRSTLRPGAAIWRKDAPGPDPTAESWRRLRHSLFPRRPTTRLWARSAHHLAGLVPAARRDFPEAEFVHRTRPVSSSAKPGSTCRACSTARVSRGQTFPDHRWRPASPSGRLRQLRPGHSARITRCWSATRSTSDGNQQLRPWSDRLCTPLDLQGDNMELVGHARGRRPDRRAAIRRVWPDRQPDRLPGPSRTSRGAGLTLCCPSYSPFASSHSSSIISIHTARPK
jgi:diaminopimelate decarboxylase